MRTEWYIGIGFNYAGNAIAPGLADELCIHAYNRVSEVCGGFSAHRAIGGEVGKPSEPTLVIVSDCPNKEEAGWLAHYFAYLFKQRAVFGFYGNESFLREVKHEA